MCELVNVFMFINENPEWCTSDWERSEWNHDAHIQWNHSVKWNWSSDVSFNQLLWLRVCLKHVWLNYVPATVRLWGRRLSSSCRQGAFTVTSRLYLIKIWSSCGISFKSLTTERKLTGLVVGLLQLVNVVDMENSLTPIFWVEKMFYVLTIFFCFNWV